MERLKQYLEDCENKRRRMRDRPNNAVLEELRTLVDHFEEQFEDARSASSNDRHEGVDAAGEEED